MITVMKECAPEIYNVDTLAEKAGVSRRTIHYYSQRGLLIPPAGDGRGSYYTKKHLDRIKELKRLSDQGIPLSKIKEYFDHGKIHSLSNPVSKSMTDHPEAWIRYKMADGIELQIRHDVLQSAGNNETLIINIQSLVSNFPFC